MNNFIIINLEGLGIKAKVDEVVAQIKEAD